MIRSLRTTLLIVCAIAFASSCAKRITLPDASMMSASWKCDRDKPSDTYILVELGPSAAATQDCHATVVQSGDGNPRACRGREVRWLVTSTCKDPIDVTVAFSPFDKNHTQNVKPNDSAKEIKAKVRGNARVTLRDMKCPPPAGPAEVCGPSYKYDIYLNGRLDKDPELEVEY